MEPFRSAERLPGHLKKACAWFTVEED